MEFRKLGREPGTKAWEVAMLIDPRATASLPRWPLKQRLFQRFGTCVFFLGAGILQKNLITLAYIL